MSYKEYTVKVHSDGTKFWFLNDRLHREDGPAIECSDGTKFWFLNGKLHREDGPAREYSDGTKEWYQNGKKHREDGPAVELPNGSKLWYLNDEKYTEKQFKKKMNPVKELTVADIERLLGYSVKIVKE